MSYFALDNLSITIYIREEEKLKSRRHLGSQFLWYLPCRGGKKIEEGKRLFRVDEIVCKALSLIFQINYYTSESRSVLPKPNMIFTRGWETMQDLAELLWTSQKLPANFLDHLN